MDILKSALEWTRAEIFSSTFFIVFGIVFVVASIGFWQLGKTEMARAFIWPTLVAGVLLLIIGIGLVAVNNSRLSSFATAYETDPTEFVQSEIARTERTIGEYQTVVFKAIPIIIIVAALMILLLNSPLWRAIGITTIAMMAVILLIDTNASNRIEAYHEQLELVGR